MEFVWRASKYNNTGVARGPRSHVTEDPSERVGGEVFVHDAELAVCPGVTNLSERRHHHLGDGVVDTGSAYRAREELAYGVPVEVTHGRHHRGACGVVINHVLHGHMRASMSRHPLAPMTSAS